ncbi:MAG: acyl-CoA synthetase [Desulfurella sp.]
MKKELSEFLKLRDFILSGPDYNTCKKEFKWPHLVKFNWALDYFDYIAKDNNDVALICADENGLEKKVTFDEMRRRSNQAANFFKDLGLQKGDRAMIMMENSVYLYEILLGLMKAGGVIIPAATMLPPEDVADRIKSANIKFLFVNTEYVDKVMKAKEALFDLVARINVGDPLDTVLEEDSDKVPLWFNYKEVDKYKDEYVPTFITYSTDEMYSFFTSGTTAKPKLVMHSHHYPVGHLTTTYWIGCKKGDIHYNISAPGWAKHAWSSFYAPWNAQSTIFTYRYKQFNAKKVLSAIEKYKVTTLCAPLSVWKLFLIEDLSQYKFSLKQLVSAGEPLNPEITKKVKEKLNIDLREGYGQTESTAMVGNFIGEPIKEGSMGKTAPGYELFALNEFLDPVKPKEDGQLAVKIYPVKPLGLLTALGDPEKNAAIFKGGYYLTGDVASIDEDGYFYFVGRADDVFKSLDYRISPFEVESEIMVHHAVLEVGVIPTVDEKDRIVPKAFIVLKPDYIASKEMALDIFRFIRDHMAPYKRPRVIEFMSAFPKTISAKVMRKDLKAYDQELRKKGIRGEFEFKESDFADELNLRRS